MRPLTASWMGGALMAGLLACGAARAADNETLYLRTPGNSVTATLKGDSIVSPDLQLYRSATAIRGRAFGRVVNLKVKRDEVSGIAGGELTRLKLNPQEGGGLEVVGLLGGELSRFKVSPQEISGTVGDCSYELRLTGTRYEGWRSCGGQLENPVFLELPPSLAQGGDAQAVATLGLFLDTP